MTDVTLFEFEAHSVRVHMDLDGNPWWVAKDVCEILGIADVSDAMQRVDQLDRGKTRVENARGQRVSSWIVNKSGLYELIFGSTKPEAKRFRRWVTSEVIPAIRKTGSYVADLSPGEILVIQAQRLVDQERRIAAALETEDGAGWPSWNPRKATMTSSPRSATPR